MIEGYEVRNVIRKNRKFDGVAINKSVNFKSMKCMSMEIDNIMECVSIELCINRGKTLLLHVSIEHAVPALLHLLNKYSC